MSRPGTTRTTRTTRPTSTTSTTSTTRTTQDRTTRSARARRARRLPALAAVGVAVAALLVPTAARAATPSCAVVWGSLDKTAAATGSGRPTLVTDLRAGRHTCYDRVVLDLLAGSPQVQVGYVPAVLGDGSGQVVPLRGGAFLHVVLSGVAYPADAGVPGYSPAHPGDLVDTAGYRTLRQVARAGAYEGYDTYGAGVRARLPFRVFVLSGPGSGSRVVLDVAHTW